MTVHRARVALACDSWDEAGRKLSITRERARQIVLKVLSANAPHLLTQPRTKAARVDWRKEALAALESIMTGTEIQCGSLSRQSTKDCAERAVIAMKTFQSDRALCVDPQGRVTVENPKSVCEYDLIGVYDVKRPLMELYREIKEELEAHAQERGWREKRRAA